MVFSSLPVNQFDSHNWQQQGNQHHELNNAINVQNPNFNSPHEFSSPPTSSQAAGSSQARVNSMVERARLAKVPLPEAALKCPRCESTNTKFCYFNNYNLTQPRHFCKTCRRYWTRGGALRNVPVGGGFRRNKRSKSNGGGRSKSTAHVVSAADNNTSTLTSQPSYSNPNKFLNYGQNQIFSPLQNLGDYNSSNIGLDFGGTSSSVGILDQWRIYSSQQAHQQFPFLINHTTTELEQSSNVLYPLLEANNLESVKTQQEGSDHYTNQLRYKPLMDMASRNVKVEENIDRDHQDRDGAISRNFFGNINTSSMGNNEYISWGGNSTNNNSSWTGFNSNNSTSNL